MNTLVVTFLFSLIFSIYLFFGRCHLLKFMKRVYSLNKVQTKRIHSKYEQSKLFNLHTSISSSFLIPFFIYTTYCRRYLNNKCTYMKKKHT